MAAWDFTRALPLPFGLHRSPPSCAVTSPVGHNPLLSSGPSYSASFLTSFGISSGEWPWWPKPQRARPLSRPEEQPAHTPSYENLCPASFVAPLLPGCHHRLVVGPGNWSLPLPPPSPSPAGGFRSCLIYHVCFPLTTPCYPKSPRSCIRKS
jgi:hypothetical protein